MVDTIREQAREGLIEAWSDLDQYVVQSRNFGGDLDFVPGMQEALCAVSRYRSFFLAMPYARVDH